MLPIKFEPIYKERVWGGRNLETTFNRKLPSNTCLYGESWELCDREEDQSIVSAGTYQGLTLNDLWTKHRTEIFGTGYEQLERFPLLIKILDCKRDLSIQVHPTAQAAKKLGGEPKTEMWYIADAKPESKLFVGLKENITKTQFKEALTTGKYTDCIHTLYPKKGDSIFLPPGMIHAIGAGHLIFEIQQNSDTTYRVYDWDRKGLDGKPRELHLEESLQSILFEHPTPKLISNGTLERAKSTEFTTHVINLNEGETLTPPNSKKFAIANILEGHVRDHEGNIFEYGDSLLLPKGTSLKCHTSNTSVLISQVV